MRLILSGLFIFFLAGCASSKSVIWPVREAPESSNHRAIIFIPGYYGSALRDVATGERRFVTFRQLFGDNFTLALGQEELKTPPSRPLAVEGVIGSVSAVPFVKEFDGYSQVLEFLSDLPNTDVYPFAYDWRLNPWEAVSNLTALVDRLKKSGVNDVSIVAHSMGGLIAAWYLRFGTQDSFPVKDTWAGARSVSRVIFAGVPFRGTMAIFRNMQTGAPMYWNEKMLQQEAVSSFPSSYFLIPWPKGDFVDTSTRPVELSARREMEWIRNDWGLLKEEDFLDVKYRRARENFTRTWLERSGQFLQALHNPIQDAPPASFQSVNIVGFGTPTLAKGYWVKESKQVLLRPWDITNFDKTLDMNELLLDGDGTVTVNSAEAPDAWAKTVTLKVARTEEEHGDLFDNSEIRKLVNEFLHPGKED